MCAYETPAAPTAGVFRYEDPVPQIRPLTLDDALAVAHALRPEDAREIRAMAGSLDPDRLARDTLAAASAGFVAALEDEPVAVAAVAWMLPGLATVAMWATPAWPRVAMAVTRHIRQTVTPDLVRAGMRRAEARSIDGHDVAHRWLASLGFVRECAMPDFGAGREMFHLFGWRLSDHEASDVRSV